LFEFLACLFFIVALSTIVLKYFLNTLSKDDFSIKDGDSLNDEESNGNRPFNCKDLKFDGHYLDVLRISTTPGCPFIVSVGMDHKILVWSPLTNPIPVPTSLSIVRQIWPITHVTISSQGDYVALFSKNGYIKCWSRFAMSWIWTLHEDELVGTKPLNAFFRRRTMLQTLRRQKTMQKIASQNNLRNISSRSDINGSSAIQPPRTPTMSRKNSMKSLSSPRIEIEKAFDQLSQENLVDDEKDDEFIILLKSGKMLTISCKDASCKKDVLSSTHLVSAKRLITARVNDRIVAASEKGTITVSTVVNNKWRTRTLMIQEERYNKGKSLMTPLAMQKTSMRMNRGEGRLSRQNSISSMTNLIIPREVPEEDFAKSTIAVVSFVGMIVRTRGSIAELIDVQTGTLVKKFIVGQFKPGSFHVFHDQPTHCRFCGCASIQSFSIVYTEIDTSTVIMHTFSIDNRAKNNICLRVERDPREIRCLGFDSVTEHQHWLEDVECWSLTDVNMIIGIRHKSQDEMIDSMNKDIVSKSGLFKFNYSLSGDSQFRSRKHKSINLDNAAAPQIGSMWEGWTMTAQGKVSFHEIPSVENEGLLIKKIGTMNRFGHKSVVVGFGNVMKVLYLGNDDLITNDDDKSNSNEQISGLSFVNRRRKNAIKREIIHSTNYGDVITPT
ncbi:uncharacterized protein ASCRUDRAFT_30790, partial [Ascoidea rubescens DSM 1968]